MSIPNLQWALWVKAEILYHLSGFYRTWKAFQVRRSLLVTISLVYPATTWHFSSNRGYERQLILIWWIAFRACIEIPEPCFWWAHWSCFCLCWFSCSHVSWNRRAWQSIMISQWALLVWWIDLLGTNIGESNPSKLFCPLTCLSLSCLLPQSSVCLGFEVKTESKSSSSLLLVICVSTHWSNQYLHLPFTLFRSVSADFWIIFQLKVSVIEPKLEKYIIRRL